MTKTYETPTADKIAFNYRDQVVAASGDNVTGGNGTGGNNRGDTTNSVVDYIMNGLGVSSCDRIGDFFGDLFG